MNISLIVAAPPGRLALSVLMYLSISVHAFAGLPYGASSYGSGWYGYGTATIITSTSQVVLPEGTTTQVTLRLNTQPPSSQTVNVSRFSGDSDITVSGAAAFVFTTGNWNQTQTFILAAATDGDSANGLAVMRCVAAEIAANDIAVTESDRNGTDDVDKDGRSNQDEYIAGTDWLNGQSRLQPAIVRQGAGITISFDALATTPEYGSQVRHYKLESTADLVAGPWAAVSGAEDIVSYGLYEYTAGFAGTKRFYRTVVWLTP